MGFMDALQDFFGFGEPTPDDGDVVVEGFEGVEEAEDTVTYEEDNEPLMSGGFFSNRRFTNKKPDRGMERTTERPVNGLKVVLCNPTEFDNCPMICGHLRSHMTVVLNLENVKSATEKRRIFDFVSGCCFALDCNIKKISEAVYVVAPSHVDLLSEVDFTEEAGDAKMYFESDYDI